MNINQFVLTAIAVGLSGSLAGAQTALPYDGPVREFRLDWATGELTEDFGSADAPAVDAFNNIDCSSGFFTNLGTGDELLDFGVKATGFGGLVSAFTFGYVTAEPDPTLGAGATIGFSIFTGATGFCGSTPTEPGTLAGSFVFSGLPGSTTGGLAGFIITVDVSTTPLIIPDGPLGWSYFETGNPDTTGPLLRIVSTATGGCASGTIDAFDVYATPASQATCIGTFAFGTPDIGSFLFGLTEDDGATLASATLRNTTNPLGYSVSSPPAVGGSFDSTIIPSDLGLTLLAISVTSDPGTLSTIGFGDILIGVVPFPFLDVAVGSHSLPVPLNASLIGVPLFSQGFRASSDGAGPGGFILNALNAQDLLIGT